MKESQITNDQRLDLIASMIHQAKSNVAKGGSFYFIMWGFIVAIANFTHYYLDKFTDYPMPYIVWLLVIPGIIGSFIYSYRQAKRSKVVGPFDSIYGQIWIAAFACIIVVLIYMPKLDFQHNAIILLISSMATYISGFMLRYSPLKIGALALFICATIAFGVSVTDQYLLGGIGITLGYLVPGFMLKRQERG